MNDYESKMMARAISLAAESVAQGGGPFGAVVTRNGKIVAEAANSVTLSSDPTAHAEVCAIRLAARRLGTHDLSGCDIFASCEPCPMCLGAIYWAHIDRIYYAANRQDAAQAGFDDDMIYREMSLPPSQRTRPMTRLMAHEGMEPFRLWADKADKREY